MIWSRNQKPWTKAETVRADRMAEEIGCVLCAIRGDSGPCDNRHHLIEGQKRMGHNFTIPVCLKHHADCHNGTINHASQIGAWIVVQNRLGLSDELPKSKLVPRKGITA